MRERRKEPSLRTARPPLSLPRRRDGEARRGEAGAAAVGRMEKRAISGRGQVRSTRTIMERASEWRRAVRERESEAAEVVSLDSPPWMASAE